MIRILGLVAALALAAPLPSWASSRSVMDEAETRPAALRFAEAFAPEKVMLSAAEAAFRAEFVRTFNSAPANVALEQRFPGTRNAALAAGATALRTIYRRELPAVRGKVAASMAEFTDVELAEITAFLISPQGQKLLASSANPSSQTAQDIGRQLHENGNVRVTEEMLAGSIDPKLISDLPEAELQQLLTFLGTPTAVKFNARGVALAQLVTDHMLGAVRASQPEMTSAIMKAIQTHISEAGR